MSTFHRSSFQCFVNVIALQAWKCWIGNKIVELVDPKRTDLHLEKEMVRCVQVGLLCVQEYAEDRPNVSTILSMLTREIDDLPSPKQPAFTTRPSFSKKCTSKSQGSINNVTVTIMEGR